MNGTNNFNYVSQEVENFPIIVNRIYQSINTNSINELTDNLYKLGLLVNASPLYTSNLGNKGGIRVFLGELSKSYGEYFNCLYLADLTILRDIGYATTFKAETSESSEMDNITGSIRLGILVFSFLFGERRIEELLSATPPFDEFYEEGLDCIDDQYKEIDKIHKLRVATAEYYESLLKKQYSRLFTETSNKIVVIQELMDILDSEVYTPKEKIRKYKKGIIKNMSLLEKNKDYSFNKFMKVVATILVLPAVGLAVHSRFFSKKKKFNYFNSKGTDIVSEITRITRQMK